MNAPLNSVAKLRMTEEGQAVILPAGMVLPGDAAVVRLDGDRVVVDSDPVNVQKAIAWERMTPEERGEAARKLFEDMARFRDEVGDFMPDGREQPPMPDDDRTYFD
ncbi:hypothetical protein HHL28_08050 [Aerophototrophica crusticola]|uniref:AbrB family transcriptional regulator n=1 Tax=Aerophototrophica crusticola TaxID=1709002 RepID=A0A858R773_9PROT|nr:hypothetical protein HHL28_08050 [Rhodospirillaceae bacterium B3]